MISAVVYGRNDSYGYNLHRRAAISLNCIAEMLSGADDEILFVDYNTPDELPTFIEAVFDTLLPRTRQLLRVLRVRAEVHQRLYRGRTHRTVLEPVARNVAIRRSNASNRWILSTTTDMIIVPRDGQSTLTAIVGSLDDAEYVLPRVDLPARLWESFPRSEPRDVLRACRELGEALHLDNAGYRADLGRDAAGAFQLMPRQAAVEVFGYDERMIYDGHVGGNMRARLRSLYGRTASLAGCLTGYHCEHRDATTLAPPVELRLENDVREFIDEIDDPHARHQAESWGLPDESFEEIDVSAPPAARLVRTLRETFDVSRESRAAGLPARQSSDLAATALSRSADATTRRRRWSWLGTLRAASRRSESSDAPIEPRQAETNDTKDYVGYDPTHVLSHLVARLSSLPRSTRFLYVGTNLRTFELLGSCLTGLGFGRPLTCVAGIMTPLRGTDGDPPASPTIGGVAEEEVARTYAEEYDTLIFDFGLDFGRVQGRTITHPGEWPRELRFGLGGVARCLRRCAEQCNELAVMAADRRLPLFVTLNANDNVFGKFAEQFLLLTNMPCSTGVRTGRARVGDERLYLSSRWKHTERLLRSGFGYVLSETVVPRVAPGESIDLTWRGCGNAYKDGTWAWSPDGFDYGGSWTNGRTADVLLQIDPDIRTDVLADVYVPEAFAASPEDPVRVNVTLEGEHLAHWVFDKRSCKETRRLLLPRELFSRRSISRLTFEVVNAGSRGRQGGNHRNGSAADSRGFGIKVQRIALHGLEGMSYTPGEPVDFREGGGGGRYLLDGWTQPKDYGTWTTGPRAGMLVGFEEPLVSPLRLRFAISRVSVSDEFPNLHVGVLLNGRRAEEWVLSRKHNDRELVVSPDALNRDRQLRIAFDIAKSKSPAERGPSLEPGALGFRLTELTTSLGHGDVPK